MWIHAQSSSIRDIYKYIRRIRRIYGEAVRGISKVRFPAARYISVFPAHEKWICRLAGGSLNFPELIISRGIYRTRKEPRTPPHTPRCTYRWYKRGMATASREEYRLAYYADLVTFGEYGIQTNYRDKESMLSFFFIRAYQSHSILINNYLLD